MFKKLLREVGLGRGGAEIVDELITGAADKATGGLVSDVADVVKKHKPGKPRKS